MADLNKVLLIGRLTRDPELRYVGSGSAVAEFGLAVNRNYTRGNGEKVEEVTFVDIVMWGKQAESANQYLSKGRSVFIEGRLNFDSWEDKNSGQKRSKINVVADRFQFMGSASDRGGAAGGNAQASQSKPAPAQPKPAAAAFDDNFDIEGDDIPF